MLVKRDLLRYMPAKNYQNKAWFDKVVAKMKSSTFFESHVRITGQYWAGRILPPNSLPPNMAANDLRCSEMSHYCRV